MNIQENYAKVLENISKITKEEIILVAVTKGRPIEDVLSLYHLGCRNFGENRLPDAFSKIENTPKDINWHFIGSLQKNKVKKAIGHFALIHGVDSYELASKISECSLELDTISPILLQVNTSGEATKHGFSEELLLENFDKLKSLPGLKIEGLMTMAPLSEDEKIIRKCFSGLRELQEKLNNKSNILKTLSMGMSHDYEIALQEGSTMLRIGSALFQ